MLISVFLLLFCYTMVDIAFGTDRFELVDYLSCSVRFFLYHLGYKVVKHILH